MAFEIRGKQKFLYLYAGVRATGSTIKKFVGPAGLAGLVAFEDAVRRADAKARRVAEEQERQAILTAVRLLLRADLEIRRVLAAELATLGFHQHDRGQWRRWKGESMTKQSVRLARRRKSVPAGSHPGPVDAAGLTKRAIDAWLDLLCRGDPGIRAKLLEQVETQRKRLATAGYTAVELMLIERVLVCSLEVEFCDLTRTSSRGISLAQGRFLEVRQAGADRRLAAALKTLAVVRKLLRSNRKRQD